MIICAILVNGRTTSLLRDQFYWPSMIEYIEHHIKSCPRCLRFKTQPEKAELNPIIATRPLELVHMLSHYQTTSQF